MKRFTDKINFGWGSRLWGCWYWTAYKDRQGYGQFRLDGRLRQAHCVSYELFVGPIPEGLLVRHMCHNPSCVNPNHLKVGTDDDNKQDMIDADRQAKGADNGNAKLTEDQVREIRQRYAEGGVTQTALGAEYGITYPVVNKIVRGEIWTHVDGARTERGHAQKLTADQVREIRRRYAEGGVSLRALGAEYGVHNSAISKIVNNKIWTHVASEDNRKEER